jgi:hypothetical protein
MSLEQIHEGTEVSSEMAERETRIDYLNKGKLGWLVEWIGNHPE